MDVEFLNQDGAIYGAIGQGVTSIVGAVAGVYEANQQNTTNKNIANGQDQTAQNIAGINAQSNQVIASNHDLTAEQVAEINGNTAEQVAKLTPGNYTMVAVFAFLIVATIGVFWVGAHPPK